MIKKSQISIILISPQMGENIGAVARAMSNFDIEDLRIVNPRDGWPNEKANAMAANGEFIVENAKVFTSVEDAIEDLEFIAATTAQARYLKKESISSKSLEIPSCKAGILFGCERSGLTNEQLAMADVLVKIPTSNKNSSLNIATAAALICYELFGEEPKEISTKDIAPKGELEFFFKYLEESLEDHSFYKNKDMAPTMKQNIRDIFLSKGLGNQDVKTLIGIVKALQSKQH